MQEFSALLLAVVLSMLTTVVQSATVLVAAAAAAFAASCPDVAAQQLLLPLQQPSDWQAAASAWQLTVNQYQVPDWTAALFPASLRPTELLPVVGPQICEHDLQASYSVQSPRHLWTAKDDPSA